MTLAAAFKAGQKARHAKRRMDSCTYKDTELFLRWMMGWLSAERGLKRKKSS